MGLTVEMDEPEGAAPGLLSTLETRATSALRTLLKKLAAGEGRAATSEEIWANSPVPVGMAERELMKELKLARAAVSVAR